MSQLQVDTILDKEGTGSPSFPNGAVIAGVNTVTTLSATTVNATTGSFTGNVSVGGTLTYEDVTNIDSVGLITARSGIKVTTGGVDVTAGGLNIAAGISTFLGEQRITTGAEKLTRTDATVNTVTLDYSNGTNVGYATAPTGNITLNVNNIPTDSTFDNHTITFAVIINNTGTARTCTAVNLNGVAKTIKWAGGSLSSTLSGVTTSKGYSIQSFTGINTVGSASTAANYEVFGVVSGGFF